MKKLISLIFLSVCSQLFAQESLEIVLKDSSRLKLTSLKIDVSIVGNFATTTYDMKFYNELDRTLEGELVFPLGEGQSVSQFAMDVNGKLREAVIVEKELARVAFESTVRQNIDPGLLEKTEGNNYKARVYPILPRKHKHVVLTFEQELSTSNKHKTYELPLGIKADLDNFSIQMQVFNGEMLPKIKSSSYKNFFFKKKNDVFTANLERQNHAPTSPVLVELLNTSNTETILSYRDYFYVNQTLKPNTRLKQKPKKINLLWDTSYSLRNRNLSKELSILGEYFEYLGDVEVHFISFSNAIHKNIVFQVQNGNWEGLKKVLKEAVYDGGTSMNLFKSLPKKSGETLMFTDGLANLGDFSITNKQAIYTINSTTSSNHELLREIATSSGGTYINLVRLPQTEAINTLKQETFQFLGAKHNSAVWEVYPKNKTYVSKDFSISGRFSEETSVELLFGYGGKVTERIKVQIKESQATELVKRLWAKQKLKHLNTNKGENKGKIISLAKSHHLITDYTSMLILDRIEDYVRYRIEPPQELKAEYKERIKNLEEEEVDNLEDLNDRKEDLFDDYTAILEWYATKYPKKKVKQPKRETSNNEDNSTPLIITANVDTTIATDSLTSHPPSARININIDSTRGIISGTVLDVDGEPLPAANVIVKGTTTGTTTDFDGNFSINADENDELEISYLGFNTTSITIDGSNSISVSLEENSAALEEVVVVGYGTEVKRAMTASATSIVSRSLQGNVAGVQITQNSGEPGSNTNVVIRGVSPMSNNNNPLYIVDGQIATNNPMQDLKPEDIEGIQVLKALSAAAIYGARASNGVIIITTKEGLESNQEAIEQLNKEITDKIELKSWNPDTPYIKILEKEATAELAYKKYLDIRDDYSNSPSFYLDVSDFFEKKEKYDIAITILTNLMEVELNNHEIMKALAYKLEYYGEYQLAAIVYAKVLELRPEEPQSYRDLALAYEQSGEVRKSYDLLYKLYKGDLLEKDEEDRFYGIEQIAFVELTRLVNKYGKELKLNKAKKEKFKDLSMDVRIVIDWNHNDTDIDLWVEDPRDEKAYYKNPETNIGGHMSEDMTEGYGPEEFMLKDAPNGRYKILVDYFADDVQKISGPTVLKVTMFTNYGKPNEERKITVVRLDKEEDELEVGNLRF
ncbi:VIT domain-containing protein [Maribacter sp. 2307UL18-2]|uniref:VIT domain-containing protein n=1 Tax=Maribacter sp. 2307UL18-2 TaxID=3386274 RepID=UPI0039BD1FAD